MSSTSISTVQRQEHEESTDMTKAIDATSNQPAVSNLTLKRQDEFYAEHRLPEPTAAGTEGRTYCFRVEFQHDIWPLKSMLGWAIEKWWSSPMCPWGDADVKVTLKPNTLTLEEVQWLFDKVGDCHVAMQTVALEMNYTADRSYLDADEMGAKVPNALALKSCLEGLAEWRDALSASDDRAIGAEIELELAFEEQLALEATYDGEKH